MPKFLLLLVLAQLCVSQAHAARRVITQPQEEVSAPSVDSEEEKEAPKKRRSHKSEDPYATLTPDEREVLNRGYITSGQNIAGGLLGTFVGFGTGHMVYGMWGTRGWIYTVGDAVTFGMIIGGASGLNNDCSIYSTYSTCKDDKGSRTLVAAGLVGYFVFRIIETIDAWVAPGSQNTEYLNIKNRMDLRDASNHWSLLPTALSAKNSRDVIPGLQLQLRF